jgi:chemotaxis protein methyltransferase CheR
MSSRLLKKASSIPLAYARGSETPADSTNTLGTATVRERSRSLFQQPPRLPRAVEPDLDDRRLRPHEFEQIRRLAREKFGLDLSRGKEVLVAARLGKLVRQQGFRSFDEYYQHVVGDSRGEALIGMINALTTNFTSFLRESVHFEFLSKEIIPHWKGRREVRLWSAGCSTGEEPYTLAFTLLEYLAGAATPAIRILATDVSTRALETARKGVYSAEHLEGLPAGWLPGFLLRGEGRSAGLFKVKPGVQRLIEFGRLNLIEPFAHPLPFALILCRNVMIYFDKPTQKALVDRLADSIEPGGYLFVGHSESLAGLSDKLEYVRPAVYRKTAGASPPAARKRDRG